MGLNAVKILGISITANSKKEILEYVQKFLLQNQTSKIKNQKEGKNFITIVTPNPEQIVLAQHDKHFTQLLNQADLAIPDGIGLVLAVQVLQIKNQKLKGKSDVQKIAGIDFMMDLVRVAVKRGYGIALIGGRGKIAVKALECLQLQFPELKGWAEDGPEITIQNSKLKIQNVETSEEEYFRGLARKIKENNTRMVFVGLGAPKQEYFMEKLRDSLFVLRKNDKSSALRSAESRTNELTPVILMAVGGSFDIIAGHIARAPMIIQFLSLEWLWRLLQEPWRWRRQLALLKFIRLVVGELSHPLPG